MQLLEKKKISLQHMVVKIYIHIFATYSIVKYIIFSCFSNVDHSTSLTGQCQPPTFTQPLYVQLYPLFSQSPLNHHYTTTSIVRLPFLYLVGYVSVPTNASLFVVIYRVCEAPTSNHLLQNPNPALIQCRFKLKSFSLKSSL